MDVVKTNANVKTVHDANKTTIHATTAEGLEMTDLDPEAHFRQDEMTDLDPTEVQAIVQAEMTDLDRTTLPDLNTSSGKCIAP
jgi:hypothetical protein